MVSEKREREREREGGQSSGLASEQATDCLVRLDSSLVDLINGGISLEIGTEFIISLVLLHHFVSSFTWHKKYEVTVQLKEFFVVCRCQKGANFSSPIPLQNIDNEAFDKYLIIKQSSSNTWTRCTSLQ